MKDLSSKFTRFVLHQITVTVSFNPSTDRRCESEGRVNLEPKWGADRQDPISIAHSMKNAVCICYQFNYTLIRVRCLFPKHKGFAGRPLKSNVDHFSLECRKS
jgi:hypothetical protein